MPKIRPLRRCPLFASLSFRDLAVLAPFVREEQFGKGKSLSQEGEQSSGLVVVASGRLRLSSEAMPGKTLELESGEYFGELSLVQEGTRGIEAKAIEASEVLILDGPSYSSLQEESPEVAGKVAQGVLISMSKKLGEIRPKLTDRKE